MRKSCLLALLRRHSTCTHAAARSSKRMHTLDCPTASSSTPTQSSEAKANHRSPNLPRARRAAHACRAGPIHCSVLLFCNCLVPNAYILSSAGDASPRWLSTPSDKGWLLTCCCCCRAGTTCLSALLLCCGALPATCGAGRSPTWSQQHCMPQPREF